MMIRMIKGLLLSAVLFAASCIKEAAVEGDKLPPVPDGYIRASLGLVVAENEQVKTRATDVEEKAYDEANVWVLMFNATSVTNAAPTTLVQAPVRAIKSGTKLYAMLRATAQPVVIYVVAGLTAAQNTYLGIPANFTEGVTTYSALSTGTQLQTPAVTAAGILVGGTTPINYIPLCTDPFPLLTGTLTLTEITADFKRIAAKIDVDASALSTADFTLEGVVLANGAQKGFLFPQYTLPANQGGVMQYAEKNTVVSNKILSQIYLYENNGTANPTELIIRGRYKGGASSYYRMDLHQETTPGVYIPYDIVRNKHYTLVITEIQNGGYSTLAEAGNNHPSNAKYNVRITDPNSHDIVSNGEYYLGLSNSEYIVYGDGTLNNLHAVTLVHNAPPTVTTATITLAGTGLTFGTVTGTTGTTTSRTLNTLNGTEQKLDINIQMAATFTTAMTGAITIQLGNLSKTIPIIRREGLNAADSQLTDFLDVQYVGAEVTSGASWVRASLNPAGGFYIRYNSLLNMGVERSAELYVSRNNNKGRVKVKLCPKDVTYLSSTSPDNIDKNGLDGTGANLFTATFGNPGNYPFKIGLFSGTTLLGESLTSTSAVHSMDLTWAQTGDLALLPRMLSLKYNVNGIWFDTGRDIQQRAVLTIRILTVGSTGIEYHQNRVGSARFGTKIPNGGTDMTAASSGSYWTSGLGPLLWQQTAVGQKPVSMPIEMYYINKGAGSANYDNDFVLNALIDYNIDILVCVADVNYATLHGPTLAQANKIINNWLKTNNFRGIIYCCDAASVNPQWSQAIFGAIPTSNGTAGALDRIPSNDPYFNHDVYKSIMAGSYSTYTNYPVPGGSVLLGSTTVNGSYRSNPIDLRDATQTFNAEVIYGILPKTTITNRGFIPLLYMGNSVALAVHPDERIVFQGESQYYQTSVGFLNANGSLTPTTKGQYPKLLMNMWEWFLNNVALGKKY